MRKLLVLLTVLTCISSYAAEFFPKPGWQDDPNPYASPDAVTGGEISLYLAQYPKSLNYYLDISFQASQIFGSLYETLLGLNPATLEYEPAISEKWSISEDKKTFTFYIDKTARWSDGKPITAQDVRWTYDMIMDPNNLTGAHKVEMERFLPPEVIDNYTIRFTARDVHWKNLGAAGEFLILPKHAYEKQDFNKINFEFPVVSGSYRIDRIQEGVFVTLERRDDWWAAKFKRNQGTGNFQTLKYKFFAENENAFEAFKKGEIDFFPIHTSRLWVNETKGEKFSKNWVIKQKVYNYHPVGFQGFAMNTRKPPFDDLRVRLAMAHLVDRRKMNSTIMYSQYFMHQSYYEDLYNKDFPNPNTLFEMNKSKARKLLREAGWVANPKTGLLEKNGKPFSFEFLTRSASSETFLAIFAEDLKDVGIELKINKKDWAAWARDMDEFNFQMTWAAWTSSIFKDPEGMWSSKEADRKGGSNITGFKSKRVDELIEKQKSIFDINLRNQIMREIDKIIYIQVPYVLLWNINYHRLLYWNKFGAPDWGVPKYGDEYSAIAYWWLDEDSLADLKDAMQTKSALPLKTPSIYFDDMYEE
ncbi:MAG: ABC transporter substrate-binding protein [Desulfobacterales bacterium]|nr:MAG: ABC transporter substrate-binding protein [Desulfobacterales bacterium]